MSSYLRAYNDGVYDAGLDAKSEIKDERDAVWSAALGPLAAVLNAWDIDAGRGEPDKPEQVAAWVEAIAADLYAKLGQPRHGDELPESLRVRYDHAYRDDAEAEDNRRERERLMGDFYDACRVGDPTAEIERELEALDVPAEWIESTRKAAHAGISCVSCGSKINARREYGQNVCDERVTAIACCACEAHGCGRDPDSLANDGRRL